VKAIEQFYIGTSGIVVPVQKTEYPAAFIGKSRLAYYATIFNSVEVNSSFYKNPRASTVAKWAGDVDEMFRFTFKCTKSISHAKHLQFDDIDVANFFSVINEVGIHKGCVLIQFPPSVSIDHYNQLEKLLAIIQSENTNWHIAIEFRHVSWYVKETIELLNMHHAAMVMHDLPKSATPLGFITDFFYLRFHGENGRYRGSYDETVLSRYAALIKSWMVDGKAGYCYFNNTMGKAFDNAIRLNELVLNGK